jgi:DNA invertase Pin-like site-specific DNA recombinase
MKLVAYARTSTEEQQLGLAAQPDKFAAYAKLYDHRIVELIAVNESAKSLKRSGLQRALQILRDGRAEGLLVLNVDRLCRDVEGGHQLLREYFSEDAKYRKHLFSVQDHVDTRTAIGRMVFTFKLAVAQYEREAISERTKAALSQKRVNGERTGSVPFGYDLAADGKTLVHNKAEQKTLRLIYRLRDQGLSQRSICQELDRRGVPTKTGQGKWRVGSLQRILKRRS